MKEDHSPWIPLELDYVKVGDSNRCQNEKRWTFEVQAGFMSPFSTMADRCIVRVPGLIPVCSMFSLCSEVML